MMFISVYNLFKKFVRWCSHDPGPRVRHSETSDTATSLKKHTAQRSVGFSKNKSKIYSPAESLTRDRNDMSCLIRTDHWQVYILHQMKKQVDKVEKKNEKNKIIFAQCAFLIKILWAI